MFKLLIVSVLFSATDQICYLVGFGVFFGLLFRGFSAVSDRGNCFLGVVALFGGLFAHGRGHVLSLYESIDLVTHVVSLGPGSDRNGGAAAAAGSPNAQNGGLVRPDGTPPHGAPRQGPSGNWIDDDGTPLMPAGQNQLSNPLMNALPFNGTRPNTNFQKMTR